MEFKYRDGEHKDPADLPPPPSSPLPIPSSQPLRGEAWRSLHVMHHPLLPLQWELGNGSFLQMPRRREMEERIRREMKEQIREEILEQQQREYAQLRRVLEEEVRREMDIEWAMRNGPVQLQEEGVPGQLRAQDSSFRVVDEGHQSPCLINPIDVFGNELALVNSLNGSADREGNSGMDGNIFELRPMEGAMEWANGIQQVTLLEQPPILGHFPADPKNRSEHDSPSEDSPMVVVGNELALIPCNKPSVETKMFDQKNPGIKRYGQANVGSSIKKARASDESWRCVVCDVTTTSEEDLNYHLQGKKHKTFVEKLNMKPTLIRKGDASAASKLGNSKGTLYMSKATVLGAPDGETSFLKVDVKSQKASKNKASSVTTVWCELCNAMCNSADVMKTHLSGRRHKAQMKKLNNGEDGAN